MIIITYAKMNDSDLLKMSFGVAAIGLVFLFLVSNYSTISIVNISELSYEATRVARLW